MCVFWGTTYLGMRIAIETIPPATLMCARYLFSGGLMLAAAKITGAHLPRGRELWATAFYGALAIGLGTGSIAFAEKWVPSGLAALMIATSPFWLVGVEALMGGDPLHVPTIASMLVGAAGVALLLAPGGLTPLGPPGGPSLLAGFLLLQVGCVGWAFGSILQRRQRSRAHPFVSGAVQQLATGVVYIVPVLLQSQHAQWTARGVGATLYLAVFGGIIGYSAYVFAMDRLPVAIASVYTYINPLVAVLLGWVFYRERFVSQEAVAMGIIFLGVALVKRTSRPPH